MHLEQLNLSYSANEDRILVRIGLSKAEADETKPEIQFFLTRRLLERFWPVFLDAIKSHLRLNRPEAAFASEELMNMEHQEMVQNITESGNFGQKYEADNRTALNGEKPYLITTIKFHLQKDAPLWMQLFSESGETVDLKLNSELLHGFCKLLIDLEKRSGWGLDLVMPKSEEMSIPAHMLN